MLTHFQRHVSCQLLRTRAYSVVAPEIANFVSPSPTPFPKKNLIGLPLKDLENELANVKGAKKYTALQLWQSMYKQGVQSLDQVTNLSKDLRTELQTHYTIHYGRVELDKLAADMTRKFLIGFNTHQEPGAIVETVLIPESKRATLCVSSQIGCSLKCSFCHTGTQKLLRGLTAAEVVGQYMIAAHRSGDFHLCQDTKRTVSNIVFMGQGEPLYNWRHVSKAIQVLTDPQGLGLSKSKITVSTSGVVPLIPKIATELGVSLAISLHATNNDLRNVLVPLNKTFPIELLLETCMEYTRLMGKNTRRITFEYVMLDGVNDSLAEARALVRLLKQLPAHVNLIPFNPWPGSGYTSSKPERIEQFAKIVVLGGIHCTVRRPRGQDIMAACGQLKSNMSQNKGEVV
ncbi:ribosomal RNA large subunit methyltransferase N [Spinellus fusiger]|nr:ribosomal RNA large subunit methyltransferase N [Spinellus fusiger]